MQWNASLLRLLFFFHELLLLRPSSDAANFTVALCLIDPTDGGVGFRFQRPHLELSWIF